MKILFIFRKPLNFHVSIENIFLTLSSNLPGNFEIRNWISPFYSKGVFARIASIFSIINVKSDIYHITGDINFIAYGTPPSRTVLTIHDLGILNNSSNFLIRWFLKYVWIVGPVKRVAKVIVVSETTKRDLVELTGIPDYKVRVIGNFISSIFQKCPKTFNKEYPNILFVGSAYNKNLDRLILALKNLNCCLTIIGFPNQNQIELLKSFKINYLIKNNLSEIELVIEYQKSDLLAFVSVLEGFGLPILEAQAIGRVVVTSNISSMPEVAGAGACFVNPFNIASIREGIINVINNTGYRNDLIEKGFQNVERYDINQVVQQHVQVYNECLNKF